MSSRPWASPSLERGVVPTLNCVEPCKITQKAISWQGRPRQTRVETQGRWLTKRTTWLLNHARRESSSSRPRVRFWSEAAPIGSITSILKRDLFRSKAQLGSSGVKRAHASADSERSSKFASVVNRYRSSARPNAKEEPRTFKHCIALA